MPERADASQREVEWLRAWHVRARRALIDAREMLASDDVYHPEPLVRVIDDLEGYPEWHMHASGSSLVDDDPTLSKGDKWGVGDE